MDPVLDHVRERRLNTTLSGGVTRHSFYAATGSQPEEVWKRERLLSRRPEGLVWAETCIEGPKKDESRAVKSIFKRIGPHHIDFKQELEALNIFSQPQYLDSFVGYHGWFEDSDAVYIAMELFMLGDLSRFMSRPFSEAEVRHLISQVVRGVAFMHSRNFSHRDLKPQNILVKESHPRWSVRIADFGISKRITDTTHLHTETGTRHYMAPEIMGFFTLEDLKLDSPKDGRYSLVVDVWSLGVLAFQLLTNSLPFTDLRALSSFVTLGMSSPTARLPDFNLGIPCAEFIKSCLAPSPLARPAASELEVHVWLKGASDEVYDSTSFITNSAQLGSSPTDIEQEFSRFEITDPSGDWDTVRPIVRAAEPPQLQPLQFSPEGSTTYKSSEVPSLNTTIGDEEFVFDDVVVNSAAYRKAFAKQMKRIENNDTVKPQSLRQKRGLTSLFTRFRQRRQSPPGSIFNQPSLGDITNLPRGYEVLPGGRIARMSALEGDQNVAIRPIPPVPKSTILVPRPPILRETISTTSETKSEHLKPSEQLRFFKDYYSQDDIHPGDQVSVIWAYQPRAADELALERGEVIKISGIWDDGWGTGVILDLEAKEWESWDAERKSGSGKNQDPAPKDGEIKAFPLVCVTLPQHWRKTIEGDNPETA